MNTQLNHSNKDKINKLYLDLLAIHGPFVSSKNLPQVLGYPSPAAFRQAISRNLMPVPLYTMPQRKGRFAKVEDIAAWAFNVEKQEEK